MKVLLLTLILSTMIFFPESSAFGQTAESRRLSGANCDTDAELITFKSRRAAAINVTVEAYVMKPDGAGPFPVAILLPTAKGLEPPTCYREEQRSLKEQGIASMVVDYYSGGNRLHGFNLAVSIHDVMRDTRTAADHLRSYAWADLNRLALIGWSRGAVATVLATSTRRVFAVGTPTPFRAAIAFYPTCPRIFDVLLSPLLIIHATDDVVAPSSSCRNVQISSPTQFQYGMKEYPGVSHRFDLKHSKTYDEKTAESARNEMKQFLKRHLGSLPDQ